MRGTQNRKFTPDTGNFIIFSQIESIVAEPLRVYTGLCTPLNYTGFPACIFQLQKKPRVLARGLYKALC